jgi:homoserine dehydrogenase
MQLIAGIALLGSGTVGSAVAQRLRENADLIERRTGIRCELRGVANRRSGDALALIDDPNVDVVIEAIGGTGPAAEFVERALERGRHVITANKDLIATQGPRLLALAASRGVSLRYEAAACSALPVVRTIGDALAGDAIGSISGVLNGTTTAILSGMESGAPFASALERAQRDGFAEADPASDLDGFDAAHKLALLVQRGFDAAVISPRIRRTGIAAVAQADVRQALAFGYRIRLIAAARRTRNGIAAEIAPLLVEREHPFAQTSGVENVVRVDARDAGTLWLRGQGAGGAASASPILGDLVTLLRDRADRRMRSEAPPPLLEPVIDVLPLFHALERSTELPYAIWNERIITDECYSAR